MIPDCHGGSTVALAAAASARCGASVVLAAPLLPCSPPAELPKAVDQCLSIACVPLAQWANLLCPFLLLFMLLQLLKDGGLKDIVGVPTSIRTYEQAKSEANSGQQTCIASGGHWEHAQALVVISSCRLGDGLFSNNLDMCS